MPHVRIAVEGHLPPKKDGASSMWRKQACVVQLRALRESAASAMGSQPPFDEPVRLSLRITVPTAGSTDLWARRRYGDLDNFITGVCDGLQAAHPAAFVDEDWRGISPEAHPTQQIAFTDDSWIRQIDAALVDGDDFSYVVTVEPATTA